MLTVRPVERNDEKEYPKALLHSKTKNKAAYISSSFFFLFRFSKVLVGNRALSFVCSWKRKGEWEVVSEREREKEKHPPPRGIYIPQHNASPSHRVLYIAAAKHRKKPTN